MTDDSEAVRKAAEEALGGMKLPDDWISASTVAAAGFINLIINTGQNEHGFSWQGG
ncbi:MAG: hypothetical protein MZV63_05235 [Marinilabiliales bacterium]|nr:hypothetical protein [Marinilabiliales bacterium]